MANHGWFWARDIVYVKYKVKEILDSLGIQPVRKVYNLSEAQNRPWSAIKGLVINLFRSGAERMHL